jgi:uroporphyrinogen-III synthase
MDTLRGMGVLITRPQPLAERLASAVRVAGGAPIVFPTMEILPPPEPTAVQSVLDRLDTFDFAVFVSQNAVLQAERLRRRPWPEGVRVAAVGAGTAAALRQAGIAQVIAPAEGGDSEALAALPEFGDLAGRGVVIFRGVGGREWLRNAFEARGARVEYAECYIRRMPERDAGALLADWRDGRVKAVVITSAEGLENLFSLLGPANRSLVETTPLFAPHARIAKSATSAGVANVIVTGPGDDGIVAGLKAYFRGS